MNKYCPTDAYKCCLYFSTSALARSLDLAQDCFAPMGMSPSHVYLLKLIIEHPGSSPGHLAEVLSLAPSTVTRFVDALERKGFIERKSQGKSVEIYPTELGTAQHPQIIEVAQRMMTVFDEVMGKEESFKLSQQLTDIAGAFNEHQI